MVTLTAVREGAWAAWHDEQRPVRLGVSGCLIGQNVRYDRGHCRVRFLTEELGKYVEWVPVCPEVEVGMGVPRPTIRLEGDAGSPRLVEPMGQRDWTRDMTAFGRARVDGLSREGLDGFVLKKDSPSCGLARVRVYSRGGAHRGGTGLFARALQERYPELPLEEEGRLHDHRLREQFVEHVFCRNRWRSFVAREPRPAELVEFHTAHKLLLRAHGVSGYRRLGRLVARAGAEPMRPLLEAYGRELAAQLARPAPVRANVDALQHAAGHLKESVSGAARREIRTAIDDYRRGVVPRITPIRQLALFTQEAGVEYLSRQLYLDPHPAELALRSHL